MADSSFCFGSVKPGKSNPCTACDRPAMITVLLVLIFLIPVTAHADDPVTPAPAGYTARMTVKNNCGVNAWMWVVPPGPASAELQSQFWGNATVNKGRKVCKANNSTACGAQNYQWKFVFDAGESKTFNIPNVGSASNKMYFNLNCANTTGWAAEWGICTIGGTFGTTTLGNDLSGVNTWFEATWGCTNKSSLCAVNPSKPSIRLDQTDWLDLSLVDGYTIPMKMFVADSVNMGCKASDSNASWDGIDDLGFLDLDSCPNETWATMWAQSSGAASALQASGGATLLSTDSAGNKINCAAPSSWLTKNVLGTSFTPRPVNYTDSSPWAAPNWYGCHGSPGPGDGPDECLVGPSGNGNWTIAETNYVQRLRGMGVKPYTWAYDDVFGLHQCNYGVNVTVTLCPAQAGQIPYQDQKWNFDFMSNTCTPAAAGKYDTYFDCISVNSFYSQVSNGHASSPVFYCMPDPSGIYTSFDICREHKPHSHDDHHKKTGVHATGQKTNNTICATGTPLLLSTHVLPTSGPTARPFETTANSTYVQSVVDGAAAAGKLSSGTWNTLEEADSPDAAGTWTSENWNGAPDKLRNLYAFEPMSFDMSMNRTPGVSLLAKWMFKGTGNATQGDLAGKTVGDVEIYKYMQKYGEEKKAARWTMVYGDGKTTNWSGMVDFHGQPTKLDDGSAFFTTVKDYGTILPKDAVFEAGTYYYLWALIQNQVGPVGDTSSGSYDLDNSSKWVFDPPRVITDAEGGSSFGTSSGCMLNPTAGLGLEWIILLAVPALGVLRNRLRRNRN